MREKENVYHEIVSNIPTKKIWMSKMKLSDHKSSLNLVWFNEKFSWTLASSKPDKDGRLKNKIAKFKIVNETSDQK